MIGKRARVVASIGLVVSVGAGFDSQATSPPTPQRVAHAGPLRITLIDDVTTTDARLREGWGFAALLEYQGHTLLLDAGLNPFIFRNNLDALGIASSRIEAIVLSHAHPDHRVGLLAFGDTLRQRPLYLLSSFPQAVRDSLGASFTLRDVAPRQELIPGVFTTGEMHDPTGEGVAATPEQALVIPTDSGLVIITSCAHPGVVSMVRRATELFGGPVRMVVGGFHLRDTGGTEIGKVVSDFRALGVRRVGPAHCSGAAAVAQFTAAYGGDFVPMGAGRVLVIN